MFENIKTLWQKWKPKANEPTIEKPVLFCVHGFGKRAMHEFDNLVRWGNDDGYRIITFNMYDIFDENDCEWLTWIQRASQKLEETLKETSQIIMVGFSMGGVIASYLASLYPVQKLILLAPAFAYLSADTFVHQINVKTKQLIKPKEEEKYDINLPLSFYPAFMEIVKQLRKSIYKVNCPVLLIHGDEDEIIPLKSSYYAYEAIPHPQKKLYVIHGARHRLLKEEPYNDDTYTLIKMFVEDQIVTNPPRKSCEDVVKALYEEKLRRNNHEKR